MVTKHLSYREESRRDYGIYVNEKVDAVCGDQVKLGAILRIADAVEIMAKNHQALIEERDRNYRWYQEEQVKRLGLESTLSHLRGYITRLKKKGTK